MSFVVDPDAVNFVLFMKKLFAIALLLTYSFSSMGIGVSLHYCCGKLKSIDWTLPKAQHCDHQQKMGSKPCCETKLVGNKEKTDQDATRFVIVPTVAELTKQ